MDDDGTVVERYVYDPYGKVTIYNEGRTSTVDWEDSKQNEILFCGYRYDPETALYHVRHRMYHPTLGRWLQRDPLGYVEWMSLYAYVVSNPLIHMDPYGYGERWEWFKKRVLKPTWEAIKYFLPVGSTAVSLLEGGPEATQLYANIQLRNLELELAAKGELAHNNLDYCKLKQKVHGRSSLSKFEVNTLRGAGYTYDSELDKWVKPEEKGQESEGSQEQAKGEIECPESG